MKPVLAVPIGESECFLEHSDHVCGSDLGGRIMQTVLSSSTMIGLQLSNLLIPIMPFLKLYTLTHNRGFRMKRNKYGYQVSYLQNTNVMKRDVTKLGKVFV